MKNYLLLLILLVVTSVAAAGTRVLPITYLTNQEAVDVLTPLLGKSESITSAGGQLVFQGSRSSYTRLMDVLKAVDVPPKVLAVSIRQAGKGARHETTSNRVSVKPRGAQQLQLLDGEPRFMTTGTSVAQLGIAPGRGGYPGQRGVTAQLGQQGFYLVAREVEGRVILRASRQMVFEGLHAPDQMADLALPIYAEGSVGDWIPLFLDLDRQQGQQIVYQVRVIPTQ